MATVLALPAADTWGMHGDVGTGWMIGMSVMMVVFWGLIILGIVWVIRGVAGGTSTQRDTPVRESAVEILERRLAEGAITPEDYRARREILTHGEPAAEGRH